LEECITSIFSVKESAKQEAVVPLKHQLIFNDLHGIISLKIALFTTTVRTSDPKFKCTAFRSQLLKKLFLSLHFLLFCMWFVSVLSSKLLLLFIGDVALLVCSNVMGV
jgi:hypothetical protein